MASIFDEIGKIGLDGKPVTFFDAMQGRGLPNTVVILLMFQLPQE